jgi:hypothetical protein
MTRTIPAQRIGTDTAHKVSNYLGQSIYWINAMVKHNMICKAEAGYIIARQERARNAK